MISFYIFGFVYPSACPALTRDDFPYESVSAETSNGPIADPEELIVLGTEAAPTPYCLTQVGDATPWILFDLQLLYHVTGFQFVDSSVTSITLAYGISRDNLTMYGSSVSIKASLTGSATL